MKRKAVIYARVSSESDRQSTTRQVDDLTAYAYRNDLEIVRVFEEKASGAKDDRPVLAACVKFCLAGEAETLLVKEVFKVYQMDYPDYEFHDTLAASRRQYGNLLPNHQLQTVAAACGFDLKQHHHALADAEACAKIAMRLL